VTLDVATLHAAVVKMSGSVSTEASSASSGVSIVCSASITLSRASSRLSLCQTIDCESGGRACGSTDGRVAQTCVD
jgi:hypothetical protein